ncbi:MAG: hypothetical protein JWN86_2746 [Planctomycetota bacterium]|nr:hypothetical protein [Planctomycetota bacterium]
MPQIFHPAMNTVARLTVFGAAFGVVGTIVLFYEYSRSPFQTEVNVVREQPVQFSHEHHSGQLGIDCRYCHTTVENGPFANIPPTHTCMSCHSQIWADSPMLKPVRDSLASGEPLRWERVHDLPDFAYFEHGIHIQKGVGCASCHGRVDEMPLTWKAEPLTMEWCLDCHRHPETHLRPRSEIFNMEYSLPEREQNMVGKRLVREYGVQSGYYLTNCTVCHR